MSNYDGKKMHRMYHKCDDYNVPFVVNQNRYNILDRQVEYNSLKKECFSKHKGLVAFSPLAQGRLSDKFRNGIPESSRLYGKPDYCKRIGLDDAQLQYISSLCEIADKRGETLSQMAIQWLLKKASPPFLWVFAPRSNCSKILPLSISLNFPTRKCA